MCLKTDSYPGECAPVTITLGMTGESFTVEHDWIVRGPWGYSALVTWDDDWDPPTVLRVNQCDRLRSQRSGHAEFRHDGLWHALEGAELRQFGTAKTLPEVIALFAA